MRATSFPIALVSIALAPLATALALPLQDLPSNGMQRRETSKVKGGVENKIKLMEPGASAHSEVARLLSRDPPLSSHYNIPRAITTLTQTEITDLKKAYDELYSSWYAAGERIDETMGAAFAEVKRCYEAATSSDKLVALSNAIEPLATVVLRQNDQWKFDDVKANLKSLRTKVQDIRRAHQ